MQELAETTNRRTRPTNLHILELLDTESKITMFSMFKGIKERFKNMKMEENTIEVTKQI